MKKCPKCNDFALYDDNVQTCPICDATLVTYSRNSGGVSHSDGAANRGTNDDEPIRPNNNTGTTVSPHETKHSVPEFETRSGLRYYYRGIITEIDSHARFHSRSKKWVNAIFRGEPYQFGNTAHETIIRIEEFHNGRIAGRKKDLIFYGDVEGRFNYGDDVKVIAKRRGDRFIVTNMYLNETESCVRPGPQIPASIIAIISLMLAVLGFYIIGKIISFVTSGAILVLFDKLIGIIIVAAIVWWLFRTLFRRR